MKGNHVSMWRIKVSGISYERKPCFFHIQIGCSLPEFEILVTLWWVNVVFFLYDKVFFIHLIKNFYHYLIIVNTMYIVLVLCSRNKVVIKQFFLAETLCYISYFVSIKYFGYLLLNSITPFFFNGLLF